ncbi:MAG: thiamine phosphate synthase [Xanthobacteraceae bacterium]|jgi:thiamine-phosphate pyrophosphorylase
MGPGRPTAQPEGTSPRIYLITPRIEDPAALIDELTAALRAADVAAVLATFAEATESVLIERAGLLCSVLQEHGAALLIDGRPAIAARTAADGAHVTGLDALEAALSALRPDRVVGAGGLRTRHDAMVAAEAGAAYVMFGEPDAGGRQPGHDAIVERVEWWAELFEVPCVGFADSLDQVARLAGAGADFVAVGDLIWNGRAADQAMRAVAERLIPEPSPWR